DATGTVGSCRVTEPKTDVRCLDMGPILILAGNSAQLTGTAKINGALTGFTIVVTDNGTQGEGKDAFSIQTGSGYNRSGVLRNGDISISS
ncbi:MAG: post-COAP-1 domain-containing protein, partial [Gaiellaceae bacterium]